MLYEHLQAGNSAEFAQEIAFPLATVFRMANTDEWLRQQVLRLVQQHGVSQKVLAAKMGLSAARLSRWLNKKDRNPVSVAALDGFYAYRERLRHDISTDDIDVATPKQKPMGDGHRRRPNVGAVPGDSNEPIAMKRQQKT